ncbi:MAG: hypothetical protein R6U57_00985 [Anaerolineales bacterium]
MKRMIIFGMSLFVFGVGLFVLYPPGRGLSRAEDLPAYSLSPGLAGMISANGVYTGDNWGGQDILEDQLLTKIRGYLNRIQVSGLTSKRLREFPSAYMVELAEVETGRHAFGLIVNKTTGDVSPEVGPDLFWNTKYGSKIAKIGGGYGMEGQLLTGSPVAEMSLSISEAREFAEEAVEGLDGKKRLGMPPPSTMDSMNFMCMKMDSPWESWT